MKTLTRILVVLLLFTATTSFAQESKYAYGIVNGCATIYGTYTILEYVTEVDEILCDINRYNAEQELAQAFSKVTSSWEDVRYNVNIFDSYEEAASFKNQNIENTRARVSG